MSHEDRQRLYLEVKDAVQRDPEATETVMRAVTDGQREANEALRRKAVTLENAWVSALALGTNKATPAVRRMMVMTLIKVIEENPTGFQESERVLDLLKEELH